MRRAVLTVISTLVAAAMAVPVSAHDGGDHAALAHSCPRPIPSAGYADTDGNPHGDAIDCLAAWGITTGTGDGRYAPGQTINRAQLASFLLRLIEHADGEQPSPSGNRFDDVDPDGPHARAINTLADLGVVTGTSDTTYSPAAIVHRGQMATFLARTLDLLQVDLPSGRSGFSDTDGHAHRDNIDRVASAGIAAGTSDTTFEPNRPVTRAQMASFVMRSGDTLVVDGRAEPPYTSERAPEDADDPGPAPGTAGDPCSIEGALEEAFGVDITAREPNTMTDNEHPAYQCHFRTDDHFPLFNVTVDGWVPAPDAQEVAELYSARDVFVGDAGIGHSAAVQHSDEYNTSPLYVDLGETSFELYLNGVDMTPEEQAELLLELARTLIPTLWPDHDFSRAG